MPRRIPKPVAERVAEQHGTECSVEIAARILRVSCADILKLVESGELVSPRRDPLGEPIIAYDSVIDHAAKVKAPKALR